MKSHIKIDLIAGARPNFIKISPIIDAIHRKKTSLRHIEYRLIHTGQHYDDNMSKSFFIDLGIPKPDYNFRAGSGTQSEQTGRIMIEYEKLLSLDGLPDLCLVVGDVNSTMACSIVAKKNGLIVAHIEGGLRSFDMTMPEEINRIVTDSITDYFFTTSTFANKNLISEGFSKEKIIFVGNTMIDTLVKHRKNFTKPDLWEKFDLKEKEYMVMTLHRPSNVDDITTLKDLIDSVLTHSNSYPIIFSAHPRTVNNLETLGIDNQSIKIMPPLGYLEFNFLVEKSLAVITDSGGITEETTYMNIPCMTLRENTERPETIKMGTNVLIGSCSKKMENAFKRLFNISWKDTQIPPLWDGSASERIIDFLQTIDY